MDLPLTGAGLNGHSQPSLPTHSIDFEDSSSNSLSIAGSEFGVLDTKKFSVNMWINLESDPAVVQLLRKEDINKPIDFVFFFNKLDIRIRNSSNSIIARLITNRDFLASDGWTHLLISWDSANGTEADRFVLFVDGVRVTSFSTETYPSQNADIGDTASSEVALGEAFDGLIYQFAVFDGVNPGASEVYDSGSPKDITNITGLYSYLDTTGSSVVTDTALGSDWTNNNSTASSTTIPS